MSESLAFTRRVLRAALPPRYYERLARSVRRYRAGPSRRPLNLQESERGSQPSPYRSLISARNPLEELGEKHEPTKRYHNYLQHYWMHFRDIRFDVRKVCEIGVQTERSLRMWEEFFPNATIYGIDIDEECRRYEGGRRKIFIGDQSDAGFIGAMLGEIGGGLDIVIDDGSHLPEHQLKSFELLFPALNSHGIYVVEDVGGAVGDFQLHTVHSLMQLIDSIMYWPPHMREVEWPSLASFDGSGSWADRNTVGIAFYRWIVFIMRGRNPEDNPYLKRG